MTAQILFPYLEECVRYVFGEHEHNILDIEELVLPLLPLFQKKLDP
jgi:hypothetical protein